MTRTRRWFGLAVALLAAPTVLAAQDSAATEHAFTSAQSEGHVQSAHEIDIMQHLANSDEIELPYWKAPYYYAVRLPHFAPIQLGPVALDLSPTKHAVFLVLAATLVACVFLLSAMSVKRAEAAGQPAKGFAGAMEATALYIRQEVILPNVGHHGEGYVPYLLTVFFFILACNLLGLLPWGATATGQHRGHRRPWP